MTPRSSERRLVTARWRIGVRFPDGPAPVIGLPMFSPLPLVLLSARLGAPSSVVRRNGFEVFLAAPKGWVIGSPKLKYDGLPAVFMRKGEDFYFAKNVMFLNLDPRKDPDAATFAANRRADFLKSSPRRTVRPVGRLLAGDGHTALVFEFDDPKAPRYERRAYLETADGVATLFLGCATPKAREAHAGAFRALVETFRDLHAPHPR